jgi:peptidoglycan/LPS O-acetylase OafA/YrhL
LTKNNRIDYLDGLRGIASLIVFINHYLLSFYPALFLQKPDYVHTTSNIEGVIAKTPISVFYSGGFAVCIFFVLSGYVLSYKYFINKSYEYLASSAVKRYIRLAIPILASVIFSFIILCFNGYSNFEIATTYTKNTFWFSSLWNIHPNIYEALREGCFSSLFEGSTLNYNSVLWTMNIEFMGSLFVFALLALAGNLKNHYFIYGLLILLFKGGFFTAFTIGLALCDYYTSEERKNIKTPILILLLLPVIYLGAYQGIEANSIWEPLKFLSSINKSIPYILAAGLLMLIIINSPKTQHVLSHKWFRFLGKVSFSLYLIHLSILGSFSCFLFKFFYEHFTLTYFASFIFTFIISLPTALFLSYLMYRFVDSNAVKLSANLYTRFFKPWVTK